MIGYLFILGALLTGAVKGFCGKKTSSLVAKPKDAVFFNTVRMLLCVLISYLFVIFEGNFEVEVDKNFILITLLSGVSNALFVITWLLTVRKNAYMTTDVALMLGSLIPAIGCLIFFGEPLSYKKLIGFALLIVAVIIMSNYNKSVTGKITLVGTLLLVITAVCEGVASFSQQLYKYLAQSETQTAAVFNFYSYVFAATTLLIITFISAKEKDKSFGRSLLDAGNKISGAIIYIVIMAVCLFLNSYCQTLATTIGKITSEILYPVLKGGSLILSSLMAAIFFNEKITYKSVIGIIVAFIGLIIINVL